MNHYFLIDKITNSIESKKDGKVHPTDVLPLSSIDLKQLTKKNQWKFNWKKESKVENRHTFKLVIKNDDVMQGLISIEFKDAFIEMHLIESAPHNFVRHKQYLGVAPNLVAYACKTAFELGFEGYVSFIAKTALIQHYIDKLGAKISFKNRMMIDTKSAIILVNSYYKDFII